MPGRGTAPARQAGFTLLEVLVALVVLGLLVVGLSQGVRTSLDLRQAQARRLSGTAELDAAQRLLRRVLSRVSPALGGERPAAGKNALGFRGEADRVEFLGELPTGLGDSRRAEISLFVHNRRLVLSWLPHRHEVSLGPPQPATETTLLQAVERLDLAYWAAADARNAGGWQSRWAEASPPALIRLRLVFGDADRRRWPDLIVAARP
jgi:general secretion pathway protein J